MSKLRRWDIWAGVKGVQSYVTYEGVTYEGRWVKYEDVKELEEEIERLKEKIDRVRAETLGYAYQWLCDEADKGRDIREIAVPELLETAERDLEWES